MHMLILTLKLEHLRCGNAVVDKSLIRSGRRSRESIHLSTSELPDATKSLTMDAVRSIVDDCVVLIEYEHIPPRTLRIQLINSCH